MLKSLLITAFRRPSPVPPVFSALFFFVVVVFIVMQHSRVTPFGLMKITPTSAHPQTRVVKELPIEDFYQRLDFKKITKKDIGQPAMPAAQRDGWIFQ